ncbi:MAG: cytochrome c oxidase subunit 3 family protein [Gammaproteobacteria bacterium]|nr:cytochrome c oxidase subunit 3 family protein [Gammaproteobacteria bacterium]
MPDEAIVISSSTPLDYSTRGLPVPNRIPGNIPIWVGIFSEMSEFAFMFIAYFLAKVHYPEIFNEGPLRLNTLAGTLNTLVLLSSSYFVAKAMVAIRKNQPDICIRWLWLAIAAAGLYLITKHWEYQWNTDQGIGIKTNVFFGVYYYMTFNHLLHVAWGGAAILWALLRVKSGIYTAEKHEGLEAVATYWHMIDLVWIIIFPLLYVLR